MGTHRKTRARGQRQSHELELLPAAFLPLWTGRCTALVVRQQPMPASYGAGDTLWLREREESGLFTGREATFVVTHVEHEADGLRYGHVLLSLMRHQRRVLVQVVGGTSRGSTRSNDRQREEDDHGGE